MTIGALHGDPHSSMHDLESFFWMLFWICIHYTGPGKEGEPIKQFENWNYDSPEVVAYSKRVWYPKKRVLIKTCLSFSRLIART